MKSLVGISSRPSDPVVMCQKRCPHSRAFWVLFQRACPLCGVSALQDCAHRPCLIRSFPPVHRRSLGFWSLLDSWTLAAISFYVVWQKLCGSNGPTQLEHPAQSVDYGQTVDSQSRWRLSWGFCFEPTRSGLVCAPAAVCVNASALIFLSYVWN